MDIIAQGSAQMAVVWVFLGLIVGGLLAVVIQQIIIKSRAKAFDAELNARVETAKKQAETIIKEAKLNAAEEMMKKREQFATETSSKENELRTQELQLSKREDTLERRTEQLSQRERKLNEGEKEVSRQLQSYQDKNRELTSLITQQKNQLLKITSLNVEQAREMLLQRLEDECDREMSQLISRKVAQTEEQAEEKSKEIINLAIQRYAAEQTCEVSVSMVDIPNDDMKGRIIGREGRNIRAFEKATGVDVIVDDTPGIIVVSGFNPIRREVARLSMERLIQDGRIHPTRIEEVVNQTKKDVHNRVTQIGKEAAEEVDVRGLNNKIIGMPVPALPHQLRAECPAAQRRGGVSGAGHGDELGWTARLPNVRSSARYRQGYGPRIEGGHRPSEQLPETIQRIADHSQCRRSSPRRHSGGQFLFSADRRGGRQQRLSSGRPT
jgi:ribonuclease Y